MYTNQIRDIIESVSSDSSLDTAIDRLISIKDELGFDDVVYLILEHPNLQTGAPQTFCTYDSSWIDHYYANNFFNSDPIVRLSQSTDRPFTWNNIALSPNEQNFMNVSKDYGIGRHGYSIPIRRGDHEFALLSVSSKANDAEWTLLERESIPIMKMFAHFYHNQFINLLSAKSKPHNIPHLTEREKECLLWSARGKSAWETAKILNISERTVTFHMSNACKKMDVPNRIMAIVQAVQQKLIFI